MFELLLLGMLLQGGTSPSTVKAPQPIVLAQASADPKQPQREQLEFEKLRLEVEALQRENQPGGLKAWVIPVSVFQSILTTLSFLVGAIWLLWRFVLAQERYPNIEFTADINPIGIQGGVLIVELIAYVENKGKAQHKMDRFGFDLNALMPGQVAGSDPRWGGQIDFPTEVAKGSFLPAQMKYFFVDPGTRAKFSYVAGVREDTQFLILHCKFNYKGRGKTVHTAEKTIRIMGREVVIAPAIIAVDLAKGSPA